MHLVAADFKGRQGGDGGVVAQVTDTIATSMRGASFMLAAGMRAVQVSDVRDFVSSVSQAAGREQVERLYVLDHGYVVAGASYKATLRGEVGRGHDWNKVLLEFGNERVGHGNFQKHEPTLQKLRPVLGRGAHVVFLNCFAGRDAALLSRFANLWGCRVSGATEAQTGVELWNIVGLSDTTRWTTVDPGKRIRKRSTHPVWGTRVRRR